MYKIGFSGEKYLKVQSKKISERIEQYEKLYLEFGGKLFDDMHGSRVLPGFDPNMQISLLQKMSDKVEIILTISSEDIDTNRIQGDSNLKYADHLVHMVSKLRGYGLYVSSVVIIKFVPSKAIDAFRKKVEPLGIEIYTHYTIDGYPTNIELTISDEGFGKNDFVKTKRPLVVVSAVGAKSGKMATCMSQLYHEYKNGKKAGYAKFEKFPVWNLALQHPVNIAYEAATTNINDRNMIDPFHLDAHSEVAVNYNRDIEAFPVLSAMFEKMWGESPYKSPTDMGVNMIKDCIIDEAVCEEASKQEIVRRFFTKVVEEHLEGDKEDEIEHLRYLMLKVGVSPYSREVVGVATEKRKDSKEHAVALQLSDGHMVSGRTTSMLTASASVLLNALKYLAKIDDGFDIISKNITEAVRELNEQMGMDNYLLTPSDVLIALSAGKVSNSMAEKAIGKLPLLKHGQGHSTTLLNEGTMDVFKRLGIDMSCMVGE